jgi:putative FmdB family regulatory protein
VPLYEYRCDACGHRFEVIQKFSDPPIDVCPVCKGAVQKLMSSPAFQFKGSGWYVTDYAKKDQKGKNDQRGDKPGTSTKPDASKTETTKSDAAKEAGSTETKSDKSDKKASSTDSTTSPSSSKA